MQEQCQRTSLLIYEKENTLKTTIYSHREANYSFAEHK